MNNIIKRIFAFILTALVVFTGIPAISAFAADNAPVHTAITTSGKGDSLKITYKLSVDKIVTSDGRIAIIYDHNVLELKNVKKDMNFSELDINTEYVNGDDEGLSYAYVNEKPKKLSGALLTLNFVVKPGVEYQDTVIKTCVYGVNNEANELLANATLEDTVTVGIGKLSKASLKSLDQTLIGVNVKWNKDRNADGYVIYRSTSKDGKYTQIGTSTGGSYWDIFVKNNTTYYYKIKSYQGSGANRVYSEESDVLSIKVKKFQF